MDSNSRPSGGDPTAAAAAGADPIAIPDWRSQLMPEARQRIVTKITDTLKRHLPEGLNLDEIQKIAVRFEEKIYSAATSQPDYLRKISLKMLSMETKTQGPRINPASNPNHQNLQNPNPGSGAMQIPQNFQLNSTNQSMPAGTQPPAGSMTSLFPPPAGSMTSLFPPPAGSMTSLFPPPAGMNPLAQPPPGMNPLAQRPPGMISLAQHQMMRQYLAQQQMSSGLTDQPNMTAGGMTQNQLNLLQQQKYLLQMHLNQIQQFQMMNMNNNNNDNMMVRSGGNNVNNNMNNMQLRGMQQMSRQNQNQQPIQQGLNCNNNINNNNNNNDNMMQLQQHQRSVGMLQTQNSAAMDSTAQKGSPSELEVVCQKQQILPQTVSTGTMMSQGGMMMSQPNKGLKQQQKLMKQNQVEVHELGLWVNPAAKIFVLLVIILFLLHTVHELGFCIINM